MQSLMQKLLGDSSLEEIEYYIPALGRVRQALEHAREQGPLSQAHLPDVATAQAVGFSPGREKFTFYFQNTNRSRANGTLTRDLFPASNQPFARKDTTTRA